MEITLPDGAVKRFGAPITVAEPGVPDYALARLVGYLGNAPR